MEFFKVSPTTNNYYPYDICGLGRGGVDTTYCMLALLTIMYIQHQTNVFLPFLY